MDDDLVEGDEYFTVIINSSSLPNGVFIGQIGQVIVIIEDDDGELTIVLCEKF